MVGIAIPLTTTAGLAASCALVSTAKRASKLEVYRITWELIGVGPSEVITFKHPLFGAMVQLQAFNSLLVPADLTIHDKPGYGFTPDILFGAGIGFLQNLATIYTPGATAPELGAFRVPSSGHVEMRLDGLTASDEGTIWMMVRT